MRDLVVVVRGQDEFYPREIMSVSRSRDSLLEVDDFEPSTSLGVTNHIPSYWRVKFITLFNFLF